jgi:hypothetical protein
MCNTLVSLVLVSFALAGCATDGASPDPDGGGGGGDGGNASTCVSDVPRLTPGSAVTLSSSPNGNPQRDYCIQAPAGTSRIQIDLTGGNCNVAPDCIGDDIELYLKFGAIPDAFEPDGSTTDWTYTPANGGFGMYVKPGAQAGAWYLSLIDGANTLGYSDVRMEVTY